MPSEPCAVPASDRAPATIAARGNPGRPWRALLGTGLLAASVLCGFSGSAAEKTAAEYAKDLESSDMAVRREAAYQLSHLGSGAKVALTQLIKALDDEQQQVWFGSVTALANLGPEAEPALPALMKDLEAFGTGRNRQGSQGIYRTAFALGSIGAAAVPPLTGALTNSRWQVRSGAAMALGFIRQPPDSVIPALVPLLSDERAEVRDAVAESLSVIGPPAVEPLMKAFENASEERARVAALDALRRAGPVARRALPLLRTTLTESGEPAVRAMALQAYCRVESDPRKRLDALLHAWRHGTEGLQDAARQQLLLIRPTGRALTPALLEDLQSTNAADRVRAAELVAELGADAQAATPQLLSLASGATGPVEDSLIRALASIGEPSIPLLFQAVASAPAESIGPDHWAIAVVRKMNALWMPNLAEGLASASGAVRAVALEGLTVHGTQAGQMAGKEFIRLLGDPEPGVRTRAWTAAATCGVEPATLISHLQGALADPDKGVRRSAMESISRLGPAAVPAVPTLVNELKTADSGLQVAAIRALGSLGTNASSAVNDLAARLSEVDSNGKSAVLKTLGDIGPAAVSVLDRIIPLTREQESGLRRDAMEALGKLGSNAKTAFPVLVDGLGDPDPGVRSAALAAAAVVDPEGENLPTWAKAALDDPDRSVRQSAAGVIAKLETRGRPAEARLFDLLASAEDRAAAVEALRAIRPTSKSALVGALGHEDWNVRKMAVEALGALGSEAAESTDALDKVMRDDPNEEVRRASRRALRQIRGG